MGREIGDVWGVSVCKNIRGNSWGSRETFYKSWTLNKAFIIFNECCYKILHALYSPHLCFTVCIPLLSHLSLLSLLILSHFHLITIPSIICLAHFFVEFLIYTHTYAHIYVVYTLLRCSLSDQTSFSRLFHISGFRGPWCHAWCTLYGPLIKRCIIRRQWLAHVGFFHV